jgi:hypothetical protein
MDFCKSLNIKAERIDKYYMNEVCYRYFLVARIGALLLAIRSGRKMKTELQARIEAKEIIVIDRVREEAKYTAKKLIYNALEVLHDKRNTENTEIILSDNKFFNLLTETLPFSRKRKN